MEIKKMSVLIILNVEFCCKSLLFVLTIVLILINIVLIEKKSTYMHRVLYENLF